MVPGWLHTLSLAALALGGLSFVVAAFDVARHPQHMAVMSVVWPVVCLFGGPVALWGYFTYGRLATQEMAKQAQSQHRPPPGKEETPFPMKVAKGAAHCGSGCTLGDICAEWLAVAFPVVAGWMGWHTIFPDKIFAVWVLDYLLAFCFGIAFQYFTIAPMRHLGLAQGLWQAVKADTLSLTAWQVGMYGWMAVAYFFLFRVLLGVRLEAASPEFWFMMQVAMWFGFITSYPVNWWLLRSGIKETM